MRIAVWALVTLAGVACARRSLQLESRSFEIRVTYDCPMFPLP